MRFVQFVLKKAKKSGRAPVARLGVELELGGDIVDLVEMKAKSTLELIRGGEELINEAKRFVDSHSLEGRHRVPRQEVELRQPLNGPDKVICIGMNYRDHCEEQNQPVPQEPLVFNKFPSCIVGPTDDIPYPPVTSELDWEVELAIVIGKGGKDIDKSQALDHVFGFTVAHDVSARDWQLRKNGGQWLLGKAMDGFCPLGPAIVTKDELSDPHNLNLQCLVNGVVKQNSNTQQMVFRTEDVVAWCSKFCTLLPGDLILTGTPPGVGVFQKPPQFLKRGDTVECVIEHIGSIKNTIV